ncbi:MAG: methylated-DNA--[protein]-cysteine S-methyltransferase [Verrucomicrobia bacterium]|jgi:O-6-methylguanine DNA methyltransferase|nr:methylated-DNA--[protein]-cysteine S-methyltransferase [Verrucomicrobiota bacterium]
MATAFIQTSAGRFTAHFSDRGLARLEFPEASGQAACRRTGAGLTSVQRAWLRITARAVRRALKGEPIAEFPPLDVSSGTEFQQRVWEELCRIAPGHTRSYAEIARLVGRPTAARAVGRACGANPIPLLIPCHRVLAADRRIGGFSGGLDWKRRLLESEGVAFN